MPIFSVYFHLKLNLREKNVDKLLAGFSSVSIPCNAYILQRIGHDAAVHDRLAAPSVLSRETGT